MCGRGSQDLTWKDIFRLLTPPKTQERFNLRPNWNVAPTQDIVVCHEHEGVRTIENMSWWLVPVWAKEKPKFATFNARDDSIEVKGTWKTSLYCFLLLYREAPAHS